MQSSSTMPPLSPAENLIRRVNSSGKALRPGQERLIQIVSDTPSQPIYTGVLPTGYGKSLVALGVLDILKQQNRANRILIIVPTTVQRDQYLDGVRGTVDDYGLNLMSDKNSVIFLNGEPMALRASETGIADVFICTIQSIASDPSYYLDLMSYGSWLVFCDEFHKLKSTASWGVALSKLSYSVLLGLSATPTRTDKTMTVFGNKEPDVEVTMETAYKEQAIRGVKAHIEHYFVDYLEEDGSVTRLSTENLNDGALSEDLRFTSKYLASILLSANTALSEKNLKHPGQHQMLIFCMNVAHAKHVSDTINRMYGSEFSNWVGVGPSGRSAESNQTIVKQYKDNEFKCLVNVDIASEGFDNPRSSVLVFLHLWKKATIRAVQQAGRGVRRNYGIDNFDTDICDMFASPDTEISELIQDFANRTVSASCDEDLDEGTGAPENTPRGPTIVDIPPYHARVQNSEFERSELISKIPDSQVQEILGTDQGIKMTQLIDKEDIVKQLIKEAIADQQLKTIALAEEAKQPPRKRVSEACKMLANNVVTLRTVAFGPSVPSSMVGDTIKAIHAQWLRLGGRPNKDMFDSELEQKYEWIRGVNTEVKATRAVPSWLAV